MKIEIFRNWLCNDRGLKETSAKDVISRLKRVDKIIIFNKEESYEKIIKNLDENDDFIKFSVFVKPQIKRAVKLYKEFLDEESTNKLND